jgi:ribosomal protein S18 acetylase RimI-like enzyme
MIIEVPYSYVQRHAAVAAREGVCVKPTARRTIWFRSFAHEGFCGLIEFAPGKWRIKGVFVQREFRGEGLGSRMTEELIRYAIDNLHPDLLEVIAGNPKFYEARSFQRLGEVRAGSGNWRLALATGSEPALR